VLRVGSSCATAAVRPRPDRPPHGAVNKPADSQHAGITTPHGDHSPHHGGLVLMNGEMHYEVVFDPPGKHRVVVQRRVREDLPASIATASTMVIVETPKMGTARDAALQD
jgi:hypothetical protein